MEHPTYAQFLNDVESFVSELSKDELKNKIMNLAESRNTLGGCPRTACVNCSLTK